MSILAGLYTFSTGSRKVFMLRLNLLIALHVCATPLLGQQARLLVSPDWLEEHLETPGLVVLHASWDGEDYAEGHIPGARLLLMDRIAWDGPDNVGVELRGIPEIERALEEVGVSDQTRIVVYGTNPMVAARAWMTLDVTRAGASEPLFLNGGLQLWEEEGRPLSTQAPRVRPGHLTLHPDPERLVSAEWILVRLGHDYLSLVDARPDDEYSGADGGLGGRLNPGHIPSARQLFWEDLVESRDRPVFLPVGQLAALFVGAGADPGDIVVTYCQVGLRASVTYMIARMLGYETRFFDGSWTDWGSRDYPHYPKKADQVVRRGHR